MKFVAKPLLAALMLVPVLAACETTQGNQSAAKEEPVVIRPASSDVPSDSELRMMTSKLSGGAVEIYDVDGDGVIENEVSYRTGGVPQVTAAPQMVDGIPLATDPRVMVYPLDDYASAPMNTMTPDPVWPNATLPMGTGYGGADMGKLPSRAGGGVSSVYFPYGSSNLSGADRSVLNTVAETAKFAPVERVSIEGHASSQTQTSDPIKSKILNLKESMNRAAAVSQDLINRGVPAEKLKTVGWGDTKPSGASEAERRRVDIITGGQ